MLLGILGWVICGVILAFIASKFVDLHGDDPRLGLAIGGAGGLVGGWLFSLFSGSPVSAFNLWSVIVAAMLASAVTVGWHFYRSRGTYAAPTIRRTY